MTDVPRSKQKSQESDEATIQKLASQTHTDLDVVRQIYADEIAALQKDATVKGFIGVIAARRVRQRLLATHQSRHAAK